MDPNKPQNSPKIGPVNPQPPVPGQIAQNIPLTTINNTNTASSSPGKGKSLKWMYFIVGGLVVLFALVSILIYFKIIPIPSLGQKSVMPGEETKSSASKPKGVSGREIVKNLPYEVVSIDENDINGRTVVYSGRVKVDSPRIATEGLGYKVDGSGIITYFYNFAVTGYLQSIKAVPGSEDRYLELTIPEEKNPVRVRIVVEPIKMVHAKIVSEKTTDIFVEDLTVLVEGEDTFQGLENIGTFASMSESIRSNLLQKGDVITIYFARNPELTQGENLLDEQSVPYVDSIFLRRIGGRGTIVRELNTKI